MTVQYIQMPGGLPESAVQGILPGLPSMVEAGLRSTVESYARAGDSGAQAMLHQLNAKNTRADALVKDATPWLIRHYARQGMRIAADSARSSGMVAADADDRALAVDLRAGARTMIDSLDRMILKGGLADKRRDKIAADASGYYNFDRISDDGPVVNNALRPNSLSMLVPTKTVNPGDDQYRVRRLKRAGQVGAHQSGNTTFPLVTGERSETYHRLQWFVTAVAGTDWLGRMQASRAGYDDNADLVEFALWLLADKVDAVLASGNYGHLGLAGMPAKRLRSTTIFGGSATSDQVIAALRSQVRRIVQDSRQTFTVDRCIMDIRTLFAATNYDNFAAGGAGNMMQTIRQVFGEHGVELMLTNVLRDLGGVDTNGDLLDLAVYFNSQAFGLKRRQAMAPTPVHTYVDPSGATVTVYAVGVGDVHSDHEGSTLVVEETVAAALA
jgi:hypothetical protein